MNYKELYHIAFLLISSPPRAWEEIRLIKDKQRVFITFVYPMIGLCGLSVFIGSLLIKGWGGPQSFQYAMTQCCAIAVSLFGGYFLAAYLINELRVRMLGRESDLLSVQQFAGYSMVVLFLLHIILGLLPGFHIIALLLQFYTVYIVWEGVKPCLSVDEPMRLRFTILISALLILCPWVIEKVFNMLTSTLN
ncbi:MAG: YIP1 family protein [Prevotellaceae bacterium]|nr:YIP1 family protein [Prevotellaceae bacterium]